MRWCGRIGRRWARDGKQTEYFRRVGKGKVARLTEGSEPLG